MGWFTNLFAKGAGEGISVVTDSIGKILDESITNKEELAAAQAKLNKTITDNSRAFVDARKETLIAEMSGSWLQRSWRPIIMLSFGAVVLYQYVFASIFTLPAIEAPERFWDMLELGLGGFITLRSTEKIWSNILVYKKEKRRDRDA